MQAVIRQVRFHLARIVHHRGKVVEISEASLGTEILEPFVQCLDEQRPPLFIKALNEWLQNLCSQRGFTYLNYFAAMVDDTGQMKADLADDGLHPNPKGYRVMAPLAAEAIGKTLGAFAEQEKPHKRRHNTVTLGIGM